ncbi:MAG: hypothetical protein FWG50_09725 [Kiritimatiellaeota bacterium]|nr:hypothetical protein [Kiritimatiellota bacterium]
MNKITVTTSTEYPFHSGASIYLNDGSTATKLSFDINTYARIRGKFDIDAGEFAYFCAVIYGCDRLISRNSNSSTSDRWTREIAVKIPVREPERWGACREVAERMLEFLTGDIWYLSFYAYDRSNLLFGEKFYNVRSKFRNKTRATGNAVSLFSGGLDSLVGVINWLEENPTQSLMLASSYDAHAENANDDQKSLFPKLEKFYPQRVAKFVARSGLLDKGQDTNFRSRSLTFLGNAVLAASFLGDGTKIIIPENGAIALNYPLDPSRSGSFSTRTVHPYFIDQFNLLLRTFGFNYTVENPYQFRTKGEVLRECKNQEFLKRLYATSVSCGKRGRKMRWHDKYAKACGHCVPCIFRQAAVHVAGFAPENYGCTVSNNAEWGTSGLLKPNGDLQTVIDFVQSNSDKALIWRKLRSNGFLERKHKNDYIELVVRLKAELKDWLTDMDLL